MTATATTTVTTSNTAKAVGSGNLDVFATPMMIALMEEAAANALSPSLEPTQSSVGTAINIEHTAASPVGAKITATATLTSLEGRKVTFDIIAHEIKNDTPSEIGKGTHTRFIIDAERFMAKLEEVK